MKNSYEFDKYFNLRKATSSVKDVVVTVLKWGIATVSLAAFYYVIFSFFINTDEERALKRENRMYEKLYPDMKEKAALLGDVVKDLQMRDNAIYKQIFHSPAPVSDMAGAMSLLMVGDSIPDSKIAEYTASKADHLLKMAQVVTSNYMKIFSDAAAGVTIPPMSSPVTDISFAQIGASIGNKYSPFYKVDSYHSGIDIMAGQGTPVVASANGVVTAVTRSGKGLGNIVEITHEGGYVTVYALLEDMRVRKGERVQRGRRIANIGISGNTFAPHLHYEVHKDGKVMDPVNYLFASFSPDEYMKVAYMAATTGQSLD